MATPETRSVELDPFTPSFDGDAIVLEVEEIQVVDADTRELPAYSFDSDDKTLAGIGSSDSTDSCAVHHFDSSDRTLVGIGPAKRAKPAESASHSPQAEPAPESIPMPHSEPPGPFIAGGDDEEVPARLPMRKAEPWLIALSAVLVAAASVALLRGVFPHAAAPGLRSAATLAPLPMTNETRYAQFDPGAASSKETSALETSAVQTPAVETSAVETSAVETSAVETSAVGTLAVEVPSAQAADAAQPAPPPATAQQVKPLELAPRPVNSKSASKEQLGVLDVSSNPPSSLVVDGRPQGKAPRLIQLPPGSHTVLFIHPERGRMSVTVNVRGGRTTSASANF
jgi:hypothetical protein